MFGRDVVKSTQVVREVDQMDTVVWRGEEKKCYIKAGKMFPELPGIFLSERYAQSSNGPLWIFRTKDSYQ